MAKKKSDNARLKPEELISVRIMLKALSSCNVGTLRNKLVEHYYDIWGETGNQRHSDEKRIRRVIDKLIDFGLAIKEKPGREYLFTYIEETDNLETTYKISDALNVEVDGEKSYYKTRKSITSSINTNSEIYFIETEQENIEHKEDLIKMLELAIAQSKYIDITYYGGTYKTMPLKIAQFDGFWYLIAYTGSYYKYRIKNITFVEPRDEQYIFDGNLKLEEWHGIFHDPNVTPTRVQLFISNTVFHYFEEKNILKVNTFKNRVTPCTDGVEYEMYITHEWELLPTLMQWQAYVTILEQDGDIDIVRKYNDILKEAQTKLIVADPIL